jgi:diguanylate cyclase (GGDEF)-like protein/PAS domain S-box-containing protein
MVDASDATPERAHLLELLEELPAMLQGFAAFDNTELDVAIDTVVARLGSTTGVDRAYVFEVHEPAGARVLVNTHEWCATGIIPQRDELQAVPMETISPWLASFEAQDMVYIPRVADLPESRPDREVLQAQDVRSLVAAPLIAEGELIGFLGFDAVRAERAWTRAELLLLEVVADAVCSAVLRRRAKEALAASERRYRLLARHSSDLVVTLGRGGGFLDISASAAALLGWSVEDALRSDPADHVHHKDWAAVRETIVHSSVPAGRAIALPDFRLRHQDGSWRWLQGSAIDLSHEPSVGGLVVIGHDITDRKRAEAALSFQAVHDPLTGLANRTLLLDRLEHALERCSRHGHGLALLFLDLDRFKVVNDALGHAAGDDLLCAYASRLRALVRTGDTVARFGGDEFIVVLEEVEDEAQAWRIAERLLADLEAPFPVAGRDHRVTASAGLVLAHPGARASDVHRPQLLADVVGDHVGRPRRGEGELHLDAVDAGHRAEDDRALLVDDLGQRAAHRGQRHQHVRVAALGLGDLVDEPEVDDVVADLRVDDGAQAVHQVLRGRHAVLLERQVLEGVPLAGPVLGGRLARRGVVPRDVVVVEVGRGRRSTSVGCWSSSIVHGSLLVVGSRCGRTRRARRSRWRRAAAIQPSSAHLTRTGNLATPWKAMPSSRSSGRAGSSPCIISRKSSARSSASFRSRPITAWVIAEADAWLIEQPSPSNTSPSTLPSTTRSAGPSRRRTAG